MAKKSKKYKPSLADKTFAAWLKYDPFVNLIVTRGEDEIRRDVMLQFLGPKATRHYFKNLPQTKHSSNPVLPQTVREQEQKFINNPNERIKIIKLLVYWATDDHINSLYINSYQTRIQIITSLLTSMFLYSSFDQSQLILSGIKKIAFQKKVGRNQAGDQSPEVQRVIINKVIDILIHNQKIIIAKAVGDTEEKMRAELVRSIQKLKGDKVTAPYYEGNIAIKKPLIKEKFPLPRPIMQELEMLLKAYTCSPWETFRHQATTAQKQLETIRCPLSVDTSLESG